MTARFYAAQFDNSGSSFFSAALAWPVPRGPLMPPEWWSLLRALPGCDFSVRISAEKQPHILLLLTADEPGVLQSAIDCMCGGKVVSELRIACNPAEYDALVDPPLPPTHLRVQFSGYHRAGVPLSCSFRLYADWLGRGLADGVGYQIAIHAHPANPERERRVRKYAAWLELEQPFTPAVRELQQILCRQLLCDVWLADEYLIFSNETHRENWLSRIRTHFAETTGKIGFSEPPVEVGDYSEYLISGCHTTRENGVPAQLAVEAANAIMEEKAAWILGQNLVEARPTKASGTPAIFISYASADFVHADAVRQYLEKCGLRCWIAPRDINLSGLPYAEAIPQAILEAHALVVLISPEANLSVHIPRELDLALSRRLPLVPLRLVNTEPAGQLQYLLSTCQWIDVFGRNTEDAYHELGLRLAALLKTK